MGFWKNVWEWTLRLNPFTAPIQLTKDAVDNLNLGGQYGGSPNVIVGPQESEPNWFQKLWRTIVTVVIIIAFIVVLLIIFKGYKFVQSFLKLK